MLYLYYIKINRNDRLATVQGTAPLTHVSLDRLLSPCNPEFYRQKKIAGWIKAITSGPKMVNYQTLLNVFYGQK